MGWFEWYIFGISFFLGGGTVATVQGNEKIRDIMFTIAIIIASIGILTFMLAGIRFSWNRFKEEDEKIFNILKQEEIK